jgi:hypothetical protein
MRTFLRERWDREQIDNLRVLLSEKILNGSGLRYDLPVDYIRKNALFVMFHLSPRMSVMSRQESGILLIQQGEIPFLVVLRIHIENHLPE